MAEYNNNQNMSDSVERDVKSGINAGKTAANAAKAISKAATGNVAGAAIDVIKDAETRRRVVIIALTLVLFFAFIIICVMYAYPMAIYESVQNIADAFAEGYKAGRFSGEGTGLKSIFKGLSEGLNSLWEEIKQAAASAGETSHGDETDPELHVVDETNAPNSSTLKKIELTKEKLNLRKTAIENAIRDQCTGPLNNYFASQFYSRFTTNRDESKGYQQDEFAGVQLSFQGKQASDSDAVKLLALYATIYDQDFSNIKLSSYLYWLGINRDNPSINNFTVCDQFTCSIPGWKGTFSPQYLVDEAKQNTDMDYSDYQCAAVDLMFKVKTPKLSSIQPIIERIEYIAYYTEQVPHYYWEYPTVSPSPSPTPYRWEGRYRPTTPTPTPQPVLKVWWETVEHSEPAVKYRVSYIVPITVSTVGTKALYGVSGIVTGNIADERQPGEEGGALDSTENSAVENDAA